MATWIVYQRPGSIYNDEPGISYEYPNTIANWKRIASGDSLIVVEPRKVAKRRGQILGWGIIDHIHSYPGEGVNEGKVMFSAVYRLYRELISRLDFDDIGDPRNNPQNAIVRVPPEREAQILATLSNAPSIPRNYDEAPSGSLLSIASEPLNLAPKEQWTARRVRQGQTMFRKDMLVLYGAQCALTGYTPAAAVDAAHIIPYSSNADHNIGNGLLLRADIHNLFDDGLVRVDPNNLHIELSKTLMHTPYAELSGQPLRARVDGTHPSLDALDQHFRASRSI